MNNTKKQIYDYIVSYFENHCYAPSYSEIMEAIGVGRATVHKYMKELFKEKYIITDIENNFSIPRAYRPKGYKCIREE